MQMRLPLLAVLALLCSGAFAECRQASGGRLQGLNSPVIWHARSACGGSTMLWLRSFSGADGKSPAWRIDDLLILPQFEGANALSLAAADDVECRRRADKESFVFAAGEWGAHPRVDRAWRVNSATKKLEELPVRDVSCAIR